MAQVYVYSFSYSLSLFNRYILNVSSLPNTILGIRNRELNETCEALVFSANYTIVLVGRKKDNKQEKL